MQQDVKLNRKPLVSDKQMQDTGELNLIRVNYTESSGPSKWKNVELHPQ